MDRTPEEKAEARAHIQKIVDTMNDAAQALANLGSDMQVAISIKFSDGEVETKVFKTEQGTLQ